MRPRILRLLAGATAVAGALSGPLAGQDPPWTDEQLARAVERALAERDARGAQPAGPDWTIGGDVRLRHESNWGAHGQPDRFRERLRLRIEIGCALHEQLDLGARLTTGDPEDPNSPHVTFGELFESFEISLDRAFVRYRPGWADSWIAAGKFAHPAARNPIYGELVWDADVQPEGIAGALHLPVAGDEGVRLVAGGYRLSERGAGADVAMGFAQLAAATAATAPVRAEAAAAYYHYGNPTPGTSRAALRHNTGNATADLDGDGTPDAFQSDFGLWHGVVGLTGDGNGLPWQLGAEVIYNARARGVGDIGWAAGIGLGSTNQPGGVRAYYQWQVIERDAVFSPFAQDDLPLATNHRSHIAGVVYRILDNANLHVWALASQQHDAEAPQGDTALWRLRVDFNASF